MLAQLDTAAAGSLQPPPQRCPSPQRCPPLCTWALPGHQEANLGSPVAGAQSILVVLNSLKLGNLGSDSREPILAPTFSYGVCGLGQGPSQFLHLGLRFMCSLCLVHT